VLVRTLKASRTVAAGRTGKTDARAETEFSDADQGKGDQGNLTARNLPGRQTPGPCCRDSISFWEGIDRAGRRHFDGESSNKLHWGLIRAIRLTISLILLPWAWVTLGAACEDLRARRTHNSCANSNPAAHGPSRVLKQGAGSLDPDETTAAC